MLWVLDELTFSDHAVVLLLQITLLEELEDFDFFISKLIFDCFVLELSVTELLGMSPAKAARFIISLLVFLIPEQLEPALILRFDVRILFRIYVVFVLGQQPGVKMNHILLQILSRLNFVSEHFSKRCFFCELVKFVIRDCQH